MKSVKIQSISDLITNSSTEAFVVYTEGNADDIKNLVNSILSLVDPTKTFDDYFEIKMEVNYEQLGSILDEWSQDGVEGDFSEIVSAYNSIDDYNEQNKFLENIPLDTVEAIFDLWNEDAYYKQAYMYEGFYVTAKVDDPIVKKVASVISNIDNIFDVDYSSDY